MFCKIPDLTGLAVPISDTEPTGAMCSWKKVSLIPERINVQNGHSVLLNNTQKNASGIFFFVPEEK